MQLLQQRGIFRCHSPLQRQLYFRPQGHSEFWVFLLSQSLHRPIQGMLHFGDSRKDENELMFSQEAHENEMSLEDDNPKAVRIMIRCLYGLGYKKDKSSTADDMLFLVDVFAIADKYDVPRLRKSVTIHFAELAKKKRISREQTHSLNASNLHAKMHGPTNPLSASSWAFATRNWPACSRISRSRTGSRPPHRSLWDIWRLTWSRT